MPSIIVQTLIILCSLPLFQADDATVNAPHDFDFGYAMEQPDISFDMPMELEEISGLSLGLDANTLLANNDELGIIYQINKSDGKVAGTFPLRKEGDYEGIEVVDKQIFVVKSSGTIYEIPRLGAVDDEVLKHKFFLTKENDVEALGLDRKNNRLLLACKGKSGEGAKAQRQKAIYAFDLATKTLLEEPVFLITLEDVCTWLGSCSLHSHVLENLNDFFDPKGEILGFSPSSLAIHPITGHIYVTSSKGKLMVVLSENGKILHIEKLKKSIHPQPEGLCFEKDGTMWISNESKKDKPARLYRFRYNG